MLLWLSEHVGGPSALILLGAVLSAIGALWASVEQTRFERELRVKSDQLAELNREIADSVIGGDSFCYLTVASLSDQSNRGVLTVVHQGKYPLYDAHARVVDLQKFDAIKDSPTLENILTAETSLSLGTLIKGHASMLGRWDLGTGDARGFNIFFSARNGSWYQNLRFRRVGGIWLFANRVVRSEQTVFEDIQPGYPRDSSGHVKW